MGGSLRVGIIGASGYTGGELFRLLSSHPHVSITAVAASEQSSGKTIEALFPNLTSSTTHTIEELDPERISRRTDVVFLALPHTTSLEAVSAFLDLGLRVIDLSADYRLKTPHLYEEWYHTAHPFPHLLSEAIYGLPEFHREELRKARLVAVPGCYPTAAILQLAPLAAHNLIEPKGIIIDAKSGVSGAGRSPAQSSHFPEAHDAIHAYKIGTHRHIPEIEQELQRLFDCQPTDRSTETKPTVVFTPHLVPMNRGILSTAYARPTGAVRSEDPLALYHTFYKHEPFVRVRAHADAVNPAYVRGANFCDVFVHYDHRTGLLVSIAALDNLVKGAAGQAIQALNIMMGFPEETGIHRPGVFP